MKLPRLRTILLAPLVLFIGFYLFGVIANLLDDRQVQPLALVESGRTATDLLRQRPTYGSQVF